MRSECGPDGPRWWLRLLLAVAFVVAASGWMSAGSASAVEEPAPDSTTTTAPEPTTTTTAPEPTTTTTAPEPTTTTTAPEPVSAVAAAPAVQVVTGVDGGLRAVWEPVSGASSYEVERDGAVIGSTVATEWADGVLAPGTYVYRARGVDASMLAGPWSMGATGTILAPEPEPTTTTTTTTAPADVVPVELSGLGPDALGVLVTLLAVGTGATTGHVLLRTGTP